MTSALNFNIGTKFNPEGINQFKAAFTSTLGTVGKVAAGMAKLATSAKFIGTLSGLFVAWEVGKAGVDLIKFLVGAAPAAARAELGFQRLETQLGRLGISSKENIKAISSFANTTGSKTRFSSEETVAAVTQSLRVTKDLRLSLKQTTIAQDLAASSGMDLASANAFLTRAQMGYTRQLAFATGIRNSDLAVAAKQGKLLDLVAEKTKNGAAKEAETYGVKLIRLQNIQQQTQESIGKMGLPLAKLGLNFKLFFAEVKSGLIEYTKAWLESGLNIGKTIQKIKADAKFLKDVMAPRDEFSFDRNKALEMKQLTRGATYSERYKIEEDFRKADEDLKFAIKYGTKELTKAQFERINQFQWAQRELQRVEGDEITTQEEKAKKSFDANQKEKARADAMAKDPQQRFRQVAELLKNAKQMKLPEKDILDLVGGMYGLGKGGKIGKFQTDTKQVEDLIKQSEEAMAAAEKGRDLYKERQASRNASTSGKVEGDTSLAGKLADLASLTGEKIRAKVQPVINLVVDVEYAADQLQAAAKKAVSDAYQNQLAFLVGGTKRAKAQESLT